MSISYWLDRTSSSIEHHHDFVIVGGGIAGLSTAYWLQKENPQARIALIEKSRLGFGASGRNAGFVTCGSLEHFIKLQEKFGLDKATEIWKFSEENRRLLLEYIIEDNAEAVDFRHTGSCTVAPSAEYWAKYQSAASVMKSQGIDVYEIDPIDLEKDYGVTGFAGGIQYSGDGFVHPIKLLQRLREKLNVDIFENTEVFSFEEGREQIVRTDHGSFHCSKVILTLNAYLPQLLPSMSSLVTPQRGQILVTKPLPPFVRGPCYLTKHLCYFRQLPTGELLIGGFRNLSEQTENSLLDQTTEIIQDALLNFVRERFKYGKKAEVSYRWSGIMGFSPDGQMLIGKLPDHKHIHLMAGCSGHGMGLSFHAAKVLAGSLSGKKVPTHLNIARFAVSSSS